MQFLCGRSKRPSQQLQRCPQSPHNVGLRGAAMDPVGSLGMITKDCGGGEGDEQCDGVGGGGKVVVVGEGEDEAGKRVRVGVRDDKGWRGQSLGQWSRRRSRREGGGGVGRRSPKRRRSVE
ncbi:unnamed protein product [Citrullus colocynthis]|uniref:Uncharacterized protein n=1 Tax=Citrullus colocynthis TaxID=252529 RepID=A0ABP0XZF7_9ROSI